MDNVKNATINVKVKNFFLRYIEFLQPFHKLQKQQYTVVALLLYYHYQFSKEITNNKILWKTVFDYDTKILITDELGITTQGLENIYTKLRKAKVIIDNEISSVYIPKIDKKSKTFTININFKIVDG
jgi:spore coat polysaccharide biosynthesis predicted glycosyltransferase SpsG